MKGQIRMELSCLDESKVHCVRSYTVRVAVCFVLQHFSIGN